MCRKLTIRHKDFAFDVTNNVFFSVDFVLCGVNTESIIVYIKKWPWKHVTHHQFPFSFCSFSF